MTLPTPIITTPWTPYAEDRGRRREIIYVIAEDGGEQQIVEVSAGYSKRRKELHARAYPATRRIGDGVVSTAYDPMNYVPLATKPLGRFSAKALDAFVAEVVANLPGQVAANSKLAGYFTAGEVAA